MTGIELIAKERQEQLEKHGRTVDMDSQLNGNHQLAHMAAILASPFLLDISNENYNTPDFPQGWNENAISKMLDKDRIGQLTVAGALIAAEIDRLQNK